MKIKEFVGSTVLDKNANAVTKAFQNLRYGYYASVRQSFYSVVRSTHSYSLRSQLLVSHTVAKKPLQLQAKPAVKEKQMQITVCNCGA